MGAIIIKIESTYISFAETKRTDGKTHILMMRRAVLPDELREKDITAHPEELAEFLIASMTYSGMAEKKLAIYLGVGTERYSEYKYSKAIGKAALEKRKEQAGLALLADEQKGLFRIRHYSCPATDDGLVSNIAVAANDDFCDRLAAALIGAGYSVIALSSTLTAFAEIASVLADISKRVLAVNAEKKEISAALFINGRLSDLKRISRGTEEKGLAGPLRSLITSETKVVLSGYEARDAVFREKLKQAGAENIDAVSGSISGVGENIVLSGELADQDSISPGVFSSLAFLKGAPPPFGQPPLSYFSKNYGTGRQYINLLAVCAAAVAIAIFICSIPPAMLVFAQKEQEANTKRLEEPFFAGAREHLMEYRSLVSEHAELMKMEDLVERPDPSYALIVTELKKDLLVNASLKEIFYEKGQGLLVDFTTKDIEAFEQAKTRMNDTREMSVYEPNEREEITEDEWRVQVRITLTPAAWEASRGQ